MKKGLILLLFFPCMLFAQDIYSDMLTEGKTWSFIRWPYGKTHQMGMRGDSVVNGMTCRKYGYVNDDGTFSCTVVFRQEGDKVYVKYPRSNDFSLAYDFGASVGDTMEIDRVRIVVTDKDIVTARGHELRRVSFRVAEFDDGNGWVPVEGDYRSSWIEGIGGSTGPESDMPFPEIAGNYDMLMDISLGDELLCDAYIFTGDGHEKLMLTYKPEWNYNKQVLDDGMGRWSEPVECHAKKTGMELPPPGNFPYTTVTIEEEQESRLLLRGSNQVLAEKASFLEYMRKAFPSMSDIYTEQADWSLDVVLYDFTLGVGDRYPCRGNVIVEHISEMTTRDGISRKLFCLSNGLLLLEGIGCLNSRYGVFGYQNDPGISVGSEAAQAPQSDESPVDNTLLSFLKYGENTAPVYILGDWEMGIGKVTEKKRTNLIHDLQGRKVGTDQSSSLKKGIYIVDGKKVIIK